MGEPFFPQGSEREALNWAKQHEKKEYHGTLTPCPAKSEKKSETGKVTHDTIDHAVTPTAEAK